MWYLNCYVNEFLQESYFMEQNIMLQYLLSNLFLLWRHIQSVHVNVLANLPRRWWSGLERFEHFPTSFMNIHCMKISLKFSKTIWCNKSMKTSIEYQNKSLFSLFLIFLKNVSFSGVSFSIKFISHQHLYLNINILLLCNYQLKCFLFKWFSAVV